MCLLHYVTLAKVPGVAREIIKTTVYFWTYAHPSYCPSVLLPIRYTATSDLRQLFIFVLFEGQVRLRQFLGRELHLGRLGGRAPQLGQARGPGAAAGSPSSSCKITCLQVEQAVGRMGVGPKMHHHSITYSEYMFAVFVHQTNISYSNGEYRLQSMYNHIQRADRVIHFSIIFHTPR